jgi:hypothetical protein
MDDKLKKNDLSNKLGRNDPCICGSGKKYKKCCLDKLFSKAVEQNIQRQHDFVNELKEQHPDKDITMISAEKAGMVKMSEIIIDYANELLDVATTTNDRHKAIMIAIAAWNIAHLDEDEQDDHINKFLNTLRDNKNTKQEETKKILRTLICKKQNNYSNIRRFIVNFEFSESTDGKGFDLNIISAVVPS